MTLRELNRIYRRAGVVPPTKPRVVPAMVIGAIAGGVLTLLVGDRGWAQPLLIFLLVGLLLSGWTLFVGIAAVVRNHPTAWLYGPSRRRISFGYVVSTAVNGCTLGIAALAVHFLLRKLLPGIPRILGGTATKDLLTFAFAGVALVSWLCCTTGLLSTALLPSTVRLGSSLGAWDLVWRVPLVLFLIAVLATPVAVALFYWGILPGCLVLALLPLCLQFLLLSTSECLPAPTLERSFPRKAASASAKGTRLRHSTFSPILAIVWQQDRKTAVVVFLFLLGLGGFSAFAILRWTVEGYTIMIPPICLLIVLAVICLQFPITRETRHREALYVLGIDLSGQERNRFWFTLGASASLGGLGFLDAYSHGMGNLTVRLSTIACFSSLWALAILLTLSRGRLQAALWRFSWMGLFAVWLFGGAQWVFMPEAPFKLPPAAQIFLAAIALTLVVAAALVIRSAWRATSDELHLKEEAFSA